MDNMDMAELLLTHWPRAYPARQNAATFHPYRQVMHSGVGESKGGLRGNIGETLPCGRCEKGWNSGRKGLFETSHAA
jgi:hypothetical protein